MVLLQKGVIGQAIFLQGPSTLASMDIDCDGEQKGGDGRCDSPDDMQSETAFKGQAPGNVIKVLTQHASVYRVWKRGRLFPNFRPKSTRNQAPECDGRGLR